MRPLMLQGHERAITQIRYNREGDLLFTVAKDATPNVWYTINGERLGTYDGHRGTVWSVDVNWDSTKVLTGAADLSCKLWDCETGKVINTWDTKSSVRSSNFSYCGNMINFTTDRQMKHEPKICIYDIREPSDSEPALSFVIDTKEMSKPMCSLWGALNEYLITGHDDGTMAHWDLKTGELLHSVREHTALIKDMQLSSDQMMLITASKDKTAKLFDAPSLNLMKTYKTDRPVNSAAISPIRDHVVLGGGQEAMDVTTSNLKEGKFDARFFHLVFEEEFGRVKGHFGPINSLAFHPNGNSYSSGGEDGFVRVHQFDESYFDFQFEC
uniref:eukaryotic translation initiation factor 3 subunit I-like n=1 Tax=Ciona intestinalis TaxID=7719 RepID=UPI0000523D74|nr:eukaryotic translation initiation factor 3 subunit I-like [Ciona intestinalis]|eukprot:XP_002122597.1 eukaryotic translation initiation factor 3 subunit I-like [Ciona intestinalis]